MGRTRTPSAPIDRYDLAVEAFLRQAVGLRVKRWYTTGNLWAIEAPVGHIVGRFEWPGEEPPTLHEAIEAVMAQRD